MDRGKVGILWVLEGLALVVAVGLAFATAIVPFGAISTRVDPATLPPGTGYVVMSG